MNERSGDRLFKAARQLPTDISPQRDLWPEIATAISGPRQSRGAPLLAQAAAVLLLIGASSSITYLLVAEEQQPVMRVAPELLFEQASFGGRYSLGPDFQEARSALIAELEIELQRLSPESRADIEVNLDIIHTAIFDINGALERDPDNTLLQQQLLNAYKEELTLLRRVGGLTRTIMARNDI